MNIRNQVALEEKMSFRWERVYRSGRWVCALCGAIVPAAFRMRHEMFHEKRRDYDESGL